MPISEKNPLLTLLQCGWQGNYHTLYQQIYYKISECVWCGFVQNWFARDSELLGSLES